MQQATTHRVLITSNPLNHEGGVAVFYNTLLEEFGDSEWEIRHHSLGSRMEYFYSPGKKVLLYPFWFVCDTARLVCALLADPDIKIVQVNPSLIPVPLLRDGVVLVMARLLRRTVVVVFHGWKDNVIQALFRHGMLARVFRCVYGRAGVTVVLADRFKNDLVRLGWNPASVAVVTTMYKVRDIVPAPDRTAERPRFLFLGRISQLKGIDELVEAAKMVLEGGCDCEFLLVGHGDRDGVIETYEERVRKWGLSDRIVFAGRQTGREKFLSYAHSDVFVFPSWTEGCPTSVIEALGSGLFVVATDVGALSDIVEEGLNGRFVKCRCARDLANTLIWACVHIQDIRSRRDAIKAAALERHEAGIVANRFIGIYEGLMEGEH
jgi:glycosyltransferase involved in cell wall biosynthesis